MSTQGRQLNRAPGVRNALVVLGAAVLVVAAILALEFRKPSKTLVVAAQAGAPPKPQSADGVGCLGYLEPRNGLLHVSAPYLAGRPQRVLDLKVSQGSQVAAGQLLAVLDGRDSLLASLHLAEARVEVARARLDQVKAGASEARIAAQRAQVSQVEAALGNARAEYRRFEQLRRQTDVSAAELDARRLAVETQEQRLAEAQEELKSVSEVRSTDREVAESELKEALAGLESARVNLNAAQVRAPAAGRVVRIRANPGEEVGPQGLLDFASGGPMYVEAEVYESDLARIHAGEQATVTSDLFSGSLTGTVDTVGTMIAKAEVLPLDPVTFADARVFKVWIRLSDGERVSGLIHGKVNVVIHP